MEQGEGYYDVHGLRFGFEKCRWLEVYVYETKNRKLRRLYTLFRRLLPDHPDEHNCRFVFISPEPKGWPYWNVLFVCDHFECVNIKYLSALQTFMWEFSWEFGADGDVHVALMNGNAEKLIVELDTDDARAIPLFVRKKLKQQ